MGLRQRSFRCSLAMNPNQSPVCVSAGLVPQSGHIFQFAQASRNGVKRGFLQVFQS